MPLTRSNLVAVAAGSLPADRRRLGIIFDPGDATSVAIKDSLLTADRDLMSTPPKFETAAAHSAAEAIAAVQDLAKRQAAALILEPGPAIDDQALIQAATKAKLPVFGYTTAQAHAGAVLVRVPNLRWSGFEPAAVPPASSRERIRRRFPSSKEESSPRSPTSRPPSSSGSRSCPTRCKRP